MTDEAYPGILESPVYVNRASCLTALGDSAHTCNSLAKGACALKSVPVYADDGGEPVPLALRQPMKRVVPPRWWNDFRKFIEPIAAEPWGTIRRPVMVCSSNYGIDGLYGLAREKDGRYAPWATPHGCVDHVIQSTQWGGNITILSHACVSAQLGLYKAAEILRDDLADEVLVLSFDYVGPFVASGFHSLKILNSGFPAPYADAESGSIGLGDGIAYAVLSKTGSGPKVMYQSLYNEMHHFTANAPDGIGFRKALGGLCQRVRDRRFWIKGHGTGTLEAGKMEAEMCGNLFPDSPLVSWKGSLGHTLGSCALVEFVLTLECQRQGTIPGTIGTTGKCFSDTVAREAFSSGGYDSTLLLSNAFGGAHGAMFLSYD